VCIIGNPLPNITWHKDGVTPPQRQWGVITYTQWAIILDDLTVSDSGHYKCEVINENGFIDYTYKLEVRGTHEDNWVHCLIINYIVFNRF